MAPMSTFTNTTKSSLVDNLIDLAHLSFRKLDSFQHRRRDNVGLREWVLIQNFVNQRLIAPQDTSTYEPLEWTEEDVKQDELNWLDAQLNGLDDLDEEENFEAGYVYISRTNEGMNKPDTMMITEDSQSDHQQTATTTTSYIDVLMDIDEEMPEIHRINLRNNPIMNTDDNACQSPGHHYDHHLFTTSIDHNYHHWKDKSTISSVQPSSSLLTHKPVRLKSTSNSEPVPPPPPISAYRPFFEPSSSSPPPQQQQQPQPPLSQQQQQPPSPPSRHPSLKVPGSFRKYCLDRDYLVGINPAEIGDSSSFVNYRQQQQQQQQQQHHHHHHHHHHNSNNVILPPSLIPYSTSANAALLNLVKLYHQSADETSINKKSTDDMTLICSSIVSSPKICQGDMAGILEYLGNNSNDGGCGGGDIVDYGAYHKITGTMENSSNIWFVGGEENVDNDRQKMTL